MPAQRVEEMSEGVELLKKIDKSVGELRDEIGALSITSALHAEAIPQLRDDTKVLDERLRGNGRQGLESKQRALELLVGTLTKTVERHINSVDFLVTDPPWEQMRLEDGKTTRQRIQSYTTIVVNVSAVVILVLKAFTSF